VKARITYVLTEEVDISREWYPPDFTSADIVTAVRAAHWEEARNDLEAQDGKKLTEIRVKLLAAPKDPAS
jgi:hypothetical protein